MTLSAAKKALLAKPESGQRWILLLGLIVSIAFSFGYVFQPIFLRFLDHKWYDTLLRSQSHGKISDLPIIVDIDEKSLAQLGRIMAIADVYDALISQRPYKPPSTHGEAVSFVARSKGTHFDPDVVEAFLKVHDEFEKIASDLPDFEK